MKSTTALPTDGPLLWTQTKAMRREYELRSEADLLGHLRFEKSCGSLASAQVDSQSWTFKREGFLNPRVTVRAPNSEANVAVFRPNWTGSGVVEFLDGHNVQWRCANFWGSEWCFFRAETPLIRFKHHGGILKVSASLEIALAQETSADLPLLAAFGWYLMLLAAEDATITAVTVATMG